MPRHCFVGPVSQGGRTRKDTPALPVPGEPEGKKYCLIFFNGLFFRLYRRPFDAPFLCNAERIESSPLTRAHNGGT